MTAHEKDSKTTVDLSGSMLTVDGTNFHVKSGKLTLRENYLYSADDDIDDPTTVQKEISIDVKTHIPNGEPWTPNDELRELVNAWKENGEIWESQDPDPVAERGKGMIGCANELEELIVE